MHRLRSLPLHALAAAILASTLTSAASTARADDGSGAFRLTVGTTIAGYREVTLLPQGRDSVALGTHRTTSYGLLAPRLGLELGGAITPEVLLGVEGFLSNQVDENAGGRTESLSWGLAPFLEVALLPGSGVRPFLRAALGGEGASLVGGGSLVGGTLGLRGGVHLFAAESFALSPHLEIRYRRGDWSASGLAGAYEGFEFVLGLSLSGWIGGRQSASSEEAVPPPPSASVAQRPPTPPTRRTSSVVVDEEGVMRMDLTLPGAVGARIAGAPSRDPRTVQFGFARISPQPAFGECTQGWLVGGTTRAPVQLSVRAEPFRSGVQETVVIRIDHESVASIVSAPGAHLELCGVELDLPASVRAPMRYFVTRFAAAGAQVPTPAATVESEEAGPSESGDQIFMAPQ